MIKSWCSILSVGFVLQLASWLLFVSSISLLLLADEVEVEKKREGSSWVA